MIGGHIRTLRASRQPPLTQRQLAEQAGLSADLVSKLEQGTKQTALLATLDKIASALGVATSDLLTRPARTTAGPAAPPPPPQSQPTLDTRDTAPGDAPADDGGTALQVSALGDLLATLPAASPHASHGDAARGDPPADDGGMALLVSALGDLLASLRADAGLSQQQLADRIGYSRATVAGAEAASRMPGESFWKRSDDMLAGNGVLHRAYRQLADTRAAKTREALRQADIERETRINAKRAELGLPPLTSQPPLPAPVETPNPDAGGSDRQLVDGHAAARDHAVSDSIDELRRQLGGALATLREAAGFNQTELARRISYDRTTICHAERGAQIPAAEFWQACDSLLGAHGTLTALHATWQQAKQDQAEAVRQRELRERRSTLEPLVALVVPPTTRSWSVSETDVEMVRELTQTFRGLDNRYGGGRAHPLVAHYLDLNVKPMLRDGRYTEEIGRKLFASAAQLSHLAAWTAYDVQEHGRTRQYLLKALELAIAAADGGFGGETLAALGHQAIHLGQPSRGLELARASQQAAKRAAIPALLSEGLALEANGHALLGDVRACVSSLHESERALERSNPAESPEWLSYFDETYLATRFAHSLCEIEDFTEARRHARRALGIGEHLTRTHAFNTVVLANTYIRDDAEEAMRVGLDAVNLARNLQSNRAVRYIRGFEQRLRSQYKDDPILSGFADEVDTLGGFG